MVLLKWHHTAALLLAVASLFASCKMPSPQYQKQVSIPQNAWNYSFKPKFVFDITDSMAGYQPYFIIRHTQAYPYSNLWLWMYIKTPGDSNIKKARVHIVLAEPNGKWMGRGMGEIWEQRMRFNVGDSIRFRKPGTYEITLEQNMRVNPLPDIMNVGIRVEKVDPF